MYKSTLSKASTLNTVLWKSSLLLQIIGGTGKICYIFANKAFYLLYSLRNKIMVVGIFKNQNGGQKSKMAARKISFYRIAPQESIYGRHSINRKNSSASADHFEKKNSKSDHFWVSYGPWQHACCCIWLYVNIWHENVAIFWHQCFLPSL